MRELLKTIFEDEEVVTYINFYETNGTPIRGYRREIIVVKMEANDE